MFLCYFQLNGISQNNNVSNKELNVYFTDLKYYAIFVNGLNTDSGNIKLGNQDYKIKVYKKDQYGSCLVKLFNESGELFDSLYYKGTIKGFKWTKKGKYDWNQMKDVYKKVKVYYPSKIKTSK